MNTSNNVSSQTVRLVGEGIVVQFQFLNVAVFGEWNEKFRPVPVPPRHRSVHAPLLLFRQLAALLFDKWMFFGGGHEAPFCRQSATAGARRRSVAEVDLALAPALGCRTVRQVLGCLVDAVIRSDRFHRPLTDDVLLHVVEVGVLADGQQAVLEGERLEDRLTRKKKVGNLRVIYEALVLRIDCTW